MSVFVFKYFFIVISNRLTYTIGRTYRNIYLTISKTWHTTPAKYVKQNELTFQSERECYITLNKIYSCPTSSILICTRERLLNSEAYKRNWIRPLCLYDRRVLQSTKTVCHWTPSLNPSSCNKRLQNYQLVNANTSKTERPTISVQHVKSAAVVCKALQKSQIDHFYVVKSLKKSKTVFR